MRVAVIFSGISIVRSLASSTGSNPSRKSFKEPFKTFKRSISAKDPIKKLAPSDKTVFCSLHPPVSRSEFSSLSPSFTSPVGLSDGSDVRMTILKGYLPSPEDLEVADGIIKYGELGLKFDMKEYADEDGREPAVRFLRLVNAKCPPLDRLLPQPSVDEDNGEVELISSNAVVFPAWSTDLLPFSEEVPQENSAETSQHSSQRSDMFEIRIPSGMDIDDGIKLLYTILPIPPWRDITAEMPARKYFVLTTCLHLRGYEKGTVVDTGIKLDLVPSDTWKKAFKVDDNNGRFDDMIVKDLTTPPRSDNNTVSNSYDIALGSRPMVESIKIEDGDTVKTSEGLVKFSLDDKDRMLTLDKAQCPRWHRPTPRKLPHEGYHLKRFPAAFDDGNVFTRLRGELGGTLVTSDKDISDAIKSLYHAIRKPNQRVHYTTREHPANDYLLTAICSHLYADRKLFGEPKEKRTHYYHSYKQTGVAGAKEIAPRQDELAKQSARRPKLTISRGAQGSLYIDEADPSSGGYRSIKNDFPYDLIQLHEFMPFATGLVSLKNGDDADDISAVVSSDGKVWSSDGRFWIEFGIQQLEGTYHRLKLASAICPLRNELHLPLHNLFYSKVLDVGDGLKANAVIYNAEAFPLFSKEVRELKQPDDIERFEKFHIGTLSERRTFEDSIRTLYSLTSPLPWAPRIKDDDETANDYFIRRMCMQLRGFSPSLPYRSYGGWPAHPDHYPEKLGATPLRKWVDRFKIGKVDKITREDGTYATDDHLSLTVGKSTTVVTPGVTANLENSPDWLQQYTRIYGGKPEGLKVEGGRVEDGPYSVNFLITDQFGLTGDEEGVLEVYAATCPSFGGPVPLNPVERFYAYRVFPTIFDDHRLFSREGLERSTSMRIFAQAHEDKSLNAAVELLYEVLPNPINELKDKNISDRDKAREKREANKTANIKQVQIKDAKRKRAQRDRMGVSKDPLAAAAYRTKEDIIYSHRAVPTITTLLAEMRHNREELERLKGCDIEMIAKESGMKTFTYTKKLEEDAQRRRAKIMGLMI
ncbi:hypothetical protein FOL47_003806 [Perkinsus chesapeaki]|uniref:Uncharacterized protein n=1 Tax=Perkinsus chesapeaki TaxID=330153 RepID=A0A7J6M6G4_PERCH|nr:hypothetical protein FOL47_003806 [Perkinsus chesapeaki]